MTSKERVSYSRCVRMWRVCGKKPVYLCCGNCTYNRKASLTLSMPEESSQQYVVTARKWRPQRFADVVGQEHVTRTLRNAVQSGRIHHAYIFNGPRGVGKTTTARILAKAVNCERPLPDCEPCNQCSSCVDINSGRSMDVIEIDGASNNSVDDVRKLRENAKYPPIKGQFKMYIIDEVHMLSTSAFNALLKTLEEPPKHLLFVFATTEPHKVPATILSRCQRFDFRRMQVDEIAAQLRYIADQEGVSIDDESLAVIGKKGDGSMRDSQSIFDQVLAFCGKTVQYARVNEALNLIDQEFFFALSGAIREHNVATLLGMAREVFVRGYDLQECLSGLAEHFRNILTVLATGDTKLIEASKLHREQYVQEAARFQQADVLQFMSIIIATEQALRFAPQPRLRFEFALVQMANMDSAVHISELLDELAELKKKLDTVSQNSAHGQQQSQQLANVPFKMTSKGASEPEKFLPSVEMSSLGEPCEPLLEHAPAHKKADSQDPAHAPLSATAAKVVSAATLAEQWKARLLAIETLDQSLRTWFSSTGMIDVVCADGEFRISSTYSFVTEGIADKHAHLEEMLAQAFEAPVRVVIMGTAQVAAKNMFEEYLLEPSATTTLRSSPIQAISPSQSRAFATSASATSHKVNAKSSIGRSVRSKSSFGGKRFLASPRQPSALQSLVSNGDILSADDANDELDAAIREIFNAVTLPMR